MANSYLSIAAIEKEIRKETEIYSKYLAEKQKMDELEMKSVNMKPTDVDDGALLMESINLSSEKMKNRPPNPQNKSEKGNRVKSNINQLTDETPIVLEDKLVNSAKKYGLKSKVSYKSLKDLGYINSLKDENNNECDGYVLYDDSTYTAYIKCDNYITEGYYSNKK